MWIALPLAKLSKNCPPVIDMVRPSSMTVAVPAGDARHREGRIVRGTVSVLDAAREYVMHAFIELRHDAHGRAGSDEAVVETAS